MKLKDDPDIIRWINSRPRQALFASVAMVISTMSIGLFKGFDMWTADFLYFPVCWSASASLWDGSKRYIIKRWYLKKTRIVRRRKPWSLSLWRNTACLFFCRGLSCHNRLYSTGSGALHRDCHDLRVRSYRGETNAVKTGKRSRGNQNLVQRSSDYGLCVRYRTVYRSAGIIIRINQAKMPDCPNGHQAFFSLFFGFR